MRAADTKLWRVVSPSGQASTVRRADGSSIDEMRRLFPDALSIDPLVYAVEVVNPSSGAVKRWSTHPSRADAERECQKVLLVGMFASVRLIERPQCTTPAVGAGAVVEQDPETAKSGNRDAS